MRALRGLAGIARRSLEDPTVPLDRVALSSVTSASDLWGPRAGTVDPLRIAAALRCMMILSSAVAGCPIKVTNQATNEEVLLPALQRYRTVGQTNFELFETAVAHVASAGNSYTYKVRARDGRIVDLMQLAPSRVRVEIDDGPAAADIGQPYVKKFVIDGGRWVKSEHEIMHVPGFSWDGVTGVSIIEHLRRVWEQASGFEQIGSELLDHGLISPSIITTDKVVDDEQDRILKARWRALAGGANSAHELMIVDRGAKLDRLTISPADAQFLQSRKFNRSEIAMIYGLPGWIINDQEKSTAWGTGMEQQFTSLVVVTLSSYFHRFEERLEREIADPATEQVKFKVEGLLRGDTKARAAFYASGIQHGWLVPNDVRPLEDLPDVEWGDEPYRPFNQSAAAQAYTDAAGTTDQANQNDQEGSDDNAADA